MFDFFPSIVQLEIFFRFVFCICCFDKTMQHHHIFPSDLIPLVLTWIDIYDLYSFARGTLQTQRCFSIFVIGALTTLRE